MKKKKKKRESESVIRHADVSLRNAMAIVAAWLNEKPKENQEISLENRKKVCQDA